MASGNIGNLHVGATSDIDKIISQVTNLDTQLKKIGSINMSSIFDFSLINRGINEVINGVEKILVSTLDTAITFERIGVALKTIFGDIIGTDLTTTLKAWADFTPFQYQDIAKSVQYLAAFGFQANQILPVMDALGNAVAGMGGGAAQMNRVTYALGEIMEMGTLQKRQMRMLTMDAAIDALKYLLEYYEKIGEKIRGNNEEEKKSELLKMIRKGEISSNVAVAAIVGGLESDTKKMEGLKKQAATLGGMFTTLKDRIQNIQNLIMTYDGKNSFFDYIKNIVKDVIDKLYVFQKALQDGISLTNALTMTGLKTDTINEFTKATTYAWDAVKKLFNLDDVKDGLNIIVSVFSKIITFGTDVIKVIGNIFNSLTQSFRLDTGELDIDKISKIITLYIEFQFITTKILSGVALIGGLFTSIGSSITVIGSSLVEVIGSVARWGAGLFTIGVFVNGLIVNFEKLKLLQGAVTTLISLNMVNFLPSTQTFIVDSYVAIYTTMKIRTLTIWQSMLGAMSISWTEFCVLCGTKWEAVQLLFINLPANFSIALAKMSTMWTGFMAFVTTTVGMSIAELPIIVVISFALIALELGKIIGVTTFALHMAVNNAFDFDTKMPSWKSFVDDVIKYWNYAWEQNQWGKSIWGWIFGSKDTTTTTPTTPALKKNDLTPSSSNQLDMINKNEKNKSQGSGYQFSWDEWLKTFKDGMDDGEEKANEFATAWDQVAKSIDTAAEKISNLGSVFGKVSYEYFSEGKLEMRIKNYLKKLTDWQKNIQDLQAKGVNQNTLGQLQSMGLTGFDITRVMNQLSPEKRKAMELQLQQIQKIGYSVGTSNVKMDHTGTITIKGINNEGELKSIIEVVVNNIVNTKKTQSLTPAASNVFNK